MLYIVSPTLSDVDGEAAAAIIGGMRRKLVHEPFRVVERATELRSRPVDVRCVVAFNPPAGRAFSAPVDDFVRHALRSGALVMPVALDATRCPPPEPIAEVIAFRVDDVLRRHDVLPTALTIAGDELARHLLAELWPMCARSRLKLFISYRGDDGSAVASQLRRALADLQDEPVQDVDHFKPGRQVAKEILEKLDPCDVLVFLDTPMAVSSDWVRWELALAMGRAIPIVWVQIGERATRQDLPVWPSDEPDLMVPGVVDDGRQVAVIAERIRQRAFEAALAHVRRACVTLDRIRSIEQLTLAAIEPRQQIHCVSRTRQYRKRPLEPERHVIQVFGRRPSDDDRRAFCEWFRRARSMSSSPISGANEAYLLSSSPMPPDEDDSVIATHGITYVEEQSRPGGFTHSTDAPQLLLLSAFPRGDGSSQEIREAVHEITTTWLSRGGRLRFGGHPTITPLVDHAAATVVADRVAEVVTVYRSRWFRERGLLDPVETAAAVVETDSTDDLDEALTIMRQRMIADGPIAAVVAVGGRTTEGGAHAPGIEEEVALARRRGLPVYLLGRSGGHTGALIERFRHDDPPWSGLGNAMSADENEELSRTDDYWRVARTIWDRHAT